MAIYAPLNLVGRSNTSTLREPILHALYINLSFSQQNAYRLKRRGTCDHDDGYEEVSVGRGCRRGHRRGIGRGMQGRCNFVQMKEIHPAARRTQSSVSNLYGGQCFLQLSSEGTVPMWMHSTDSERLSPKLEKIMSKPRHRRAYWSLLIDSLASWLR